MLSPRLEFLHLVVWEKVSALRVKMMPVLFVA